MPVSSESHDELLDVEAVARRLDVGPVTVYRWCRKGRLRCLKPGKDWRIRSSDLDAFLQQSSRPHSLTGHLDRFFMTPDQVLSVVEDAALLIQLDAAVFQVGAARDALLVKIYDPQATTRPVLQAGLRQHGLDVDRLEARGLLHWSPARTLEEGVASLEKTLSQERAREQPIWAVFDWPGVDEMEAKLHQQEMLATLVAAYPQLVVSTGVVEPEPEAWPPLAEQWQLLGSLRGVIRFARAGLLLSRVVTAPML